MHSYVSHAQILALQWEVVLYQFRYHCKQYDFCFDFCKQDIALIYQINSANLAIIRRTIEHAMEFSIWAITYRLSLFGWIGIKHLLITLHLNLIVCIVLWEISNILIATINIHWFIALTSLSLLHREIEIPSVSVRNIEPIMRCHVITIREMCTLFADFLEIMLR